MGCPPRILGGAASPLALFRPVAGTAHGLACLFLLALGPCETSSPRTQSAVRTANPLTWKLTAQPLLEIGSVDDSLYALDRVVGARFLPTGDIAVADGGLARVMIFDSGGRHLLTTGRKGRGPGEFDWISELFVSSDSIWIHDQNLRRMTVLALDGQVRRVFSIDHNVLGPVSPFGRFRNGMIAARVGWTSSSLPPEPATGLFRPDAAYVLLAAEGAMIDTFAVTRGEEVFRRVVDGRMTFAIPPLARGSIEFFRDELAYLGSTDRDVILVYGPGGVLLDSIVGRQGRGPPTEAEVEEARESWLHGVGDSPGARRRLLELLEEMPVPDFKPVVSGLVVDDQGQVWISERPRISGRARL